MNWRRLFTRRGPIERAIVQDAQAEYVMWLQTSLTGLQAKYNEAMKLEAENKALRDRAETAEVKVADLHAHLVAAHAQQQQLLAYIAQYRAANQDMWAQAAALGEAHATRDKMRLEAMLGHCAEVWRTQQALASSGRIH